MKRILTIAGVVWLGVLRRKDVYVVFFLLLASLVGIASIDIFGLSGLTGYVKEAGLLLIWLFAWMLSVNISTRLLPEEEARGTVFALLARPVTRSQVITGKWVGSWTIVCAVTIVFYFTLIGIVLLRGSVFNWNTLAQALVLHLCMLAVISSLGIAISTRLNHDAAATMTYVLSITSFFLLPRVPHLVINADGFRQTMLLVVYYAFPHFALFDMRRRLIHDFGAVPAQTFFTVLAYGLLMTVVFLVLGWIGYRTRRFSRGVIQ